MIVEQIIHNALINPERVAIKVNSSALSYAELQQQLLEREAQLRTFDGNVVFIKTKGADGITLFLAALQAGKNVIVLPHSLTLFQKEQLFKLYHIQELEIDDKNKILCGTTPHHKGQIGILSSGSTAEPKVIWKTQLNWESAFVHQTDIFKISNGAQTLVIDAMGYSANLNAAIHTLWKGNTLHLSSFQEIRSLGNLIAREAIETLYLVPSHARLLLQNSGAQKSVKSIITAGEKLDILTAKGLLEKYPDLTLTEYYGAAELGHISYHQNQDILEHPSAVGKPFPGVTVQIHGEEIIVESPYISPDYADKKSVNDLGYFENGRLILKGRAGRVFNRRGLNIYAEEIENLAMNFGGVQSVALVATSDQKLILYFSVSEAITFNSQELIRYLREILPTAKMPNHVVLLTELPHSDAGKIDFKALSKMNEEQVF